MVMLNIYYFFCHLSILLNSLLLIKLLCVMLIPKCDFSGFIMMTPQLFINYKMKSVAHLPWRMLTYKALNTFIDDLFAFVIKMPTLYRLGCFRDGKLSCSRTKMPND